MGNGIFSEMQVLIVENKKKEQSCQNLLEILGCEVDIQNNVTKAIKYFKNEKKSFDVILLDAEMP